MGVPEKALIAADEIVEYIPQRPPIVMAEIMPVTSRETATTIAACIPTVILATINAPVAPEMMPQISPTTSLQMLDTFSALRDIQTASRAPRTLCAAME